MGCIVLLRKGEATLPALKDIEAKVKELNDPASGRMLPGVEIVPYYDRTRADQHDDPHGGREPADRAWAWSFVILLMFLGNVRTAVIVAINIPLALLFAFSVLYLRGKSANLLSIGAVDFGIIVDSSVIIAENIYRHLASGEDAELPLKTRIFRAASEIDRALLFSTLIMVCAFIPLFTLEGPAGRSVRTHGADLRLGARRGAGAGPDVVARAVPAAVQESQAGGGQLLRPLHQAHAT